MGLTAVGSREIDDEVLTLAASGWLYQMTFVLVDLETYSFWFPRALSTGLLTCVSGDYLDRMLAEFDSVKMPWNEWRALHPDTKYMKPP